MIAPQLQHLELRCTASRFDTPLPLLDFSLSTQLSTLLLTGPWQIGNGNAINTLTNLEYILDAFRTKINEEARSSLKEALKRWPRLTRVHISGVTIHKFKDVSSLKYAQLSLNHVS
jgi:hypothetical protein